MRRILSSLILIVLAGPGAAQTIDAQGADKLGDTLALYLGKTAFEKGIVKVAPDGDAYRIDISMNELAGLLPAGPFKYDVAPYPLRVKPLADGTWQVDGPILPAGWFEVTEPTARQRVDWTISDGKLSGIYDPALGTLSSGTGSFSGIKVATDAATGKGQTSYGAGTIDVSAKKSANGGVDVDSKQVIADFNQTQTIVEPSSGTNIALTIEAATLAVDSAGTNVKMKEILDLLAFGVAHPDPETLKANQQEMKSLVLAALPIWDNLDGSYALSKLSVTTPFGILRSGEAAFSMSMDGIRQDGDLNYNFGLKDIEVASFFVPAWARPLMPTEIDVNVGGAGINLDEPARKLIAAFDAAQQPPVPETLLNEIGAEFMTNPPRIVFEKSTIRNADMELTAEGEFTFAMGQATLDMTLEAAGYDKAVEALQAAASTDPQVAEVLPAIMMVKGFSKTLPDGRLQWKVNARPDGSIAVNGTVVKPADPAPQ